MFGADGLRVRVGKQSQGRMTLSEMTAGCMGLQCRPVLTAY